MANRDGAAQPTNAMQKVLDEYAAFNAPAIESLEPRLARELPTIADAAISVIEKNIVARATSPVMPAVAGLLHRVMQGPGGPLLLRVYRPEGEGPFPAVVYFHGGGWVIANLNVYDSSCRSLCRDAKAVVVSVAYRQAPEFPFPAAVDDAFAAYQWVLAHAVDIGGDGRVAVAGESAGGNLATVVCQIAMERGVRAPLHQVLVYPVTDFAANTESMEEFYDARPLSSPMLQWFAKHYLGQMNKSDPHASPLRGTLSGLPPATVITAEIDPLRDGAEQYALAMQEAGVDVVLKRYDGVTHEFFGMGAGLPEARAAVGLAAERLSEAFAQERASEAA